MWVIDSWAWVLDISPTSSAYRQTLEIQDNSHLHAFTLTLEHLYKTTHYWLTIVSSSTLGLSLVFSAPQHLMAQKKLWSVLLQRVREGLTNEMMLKA